MKKSSKKKTPLESRCWNTRGVWSTVDKKCELLAEHVHCRNCPVFSIEGKHVLDRPAPVGYLKEWRRTLAAEKQKENNNLKAVLIYRVGDEWFALPTGCLQEITEKKVVHRIPRNTNSSISGVVNIGGEVRVCYSFGSILGVKNYTKYKDDSFIANGGRFIVAVFDGLTYVFFVDQVSGLFWYGDVEVSPVASSI